MEQGVSGRCVSGYVLYLLLALALPFPFLFTALPFPSLSVCLFRCFLGGRCACLHNAMFALVISHGAGALC